MARRRRNFFLCQTTPNRAPTGARNFLKMRPICCLGNQMQARNFVPRSTPKLRTDRCAEFFQIENHLLPWQYKNGSPRARFVFPCQDSTKLRTDRCAENFEKETHLLPWQHKNGLPQARFFCFKTASKLGGTQKFLRGKIVVLVTQSGPLQARNFVGHVLIFSQKHRVLTPPDK